MNQDRLYYDCTGKILDAAELMNALSRNANFNIIADHVVRPDLHEVYQRAQDLYNSIYELVKKQMDIKIPKHEVHHNH